MVYIVASVAVVFFIAALMYFNVSSLNKKNGNFENSSKSQVSFVKCPVCSSNLLKGQKLFSKIFRSSQTANDQLCYIYGCSNCYPFCKKDIKRSCPVCGKDVSQEGYLLARMFNKTKSGKPHVIINGCGNCGRKK